MVGLDGSGDRTSQAPFTVQSLKNLLGELGVNVPANVNPQLKNVAAVAIHPWLPLVAAGSGCRRRSRGAGGSGSDESGSDDDDSSNADNDEEAALPRAALSFWRPSYTWRENETARNHE